MPVAQYVKYRLNTINDTINTKWNFAEILQPLVQLQNSIHVRSSCAGCRGLALIGEKPSFFRSFPT
jgi:hypothetical protein